MDWLANMQAWQALPAEKRRAQAWAQIPASVAASMAFEGEPVDQTWLEELHRRGAPGSPPAIDTDQVSKPGVIDGNPRTNE